MITLKLNDESFDKIMFKDCETAAISTEVSSGIVNYIMIKNSEVLDFCALIDKKIIEAAKTTLNLDNIEENYRSLVTKPVKEDQTPSIFVPVKTVDMKIDLLAPIILHKDSKLPLLSDTPLKQSRLDRYNDDFDDLVERNKGRPPFNYINS